MVIHILDQSFKLVGIIDNYISVIWRPAYYDIGDFELYLSADAKAVDLLQKNYYLVRDTDIEVDQDGNVTYSKVMIIKNFIINEDVEEGDHLTVTGKELKFILNQRIVWTQTNLTGTVEAGIRKLINDNAIAPVNKVRIIPNLVLGAVAGFTDKIEKQLTGDKLDEAIVEICKTYGYGWEIFIYNSTMVFIIYKGLDRSYGQTDRPYVVFSESFDNVLESGYELNSESYANATRIGGEGEGLDRIYATIGDNVSGLDRYEVFTDARDVSRNQPASVAAALSNEDIENAINSADMVSTYAVESTEVTESDEEITLDMPTYLTLLRERGNENLAGLSMTEGFSGEVVTEGSFTYGVDFYLGDIVSIKNKYGITKNVMVLSAIESVDDSGTKLVPQFNI